MNYIDNNGNYINNENLSLREIYERGFIEGVKKCDHPAIIRAKKMTAEEKQNFAKEYMKYSETGLIFTKDDLEVVPLVGFTRKELEGWLYEIAGNNLNNEFGTYCEELINRLDGFERYARDKRAEDAHEDLSDNSLQE